MFFGKIKNSEKWGFSILESTFDSFVVVDERTHIEMIERSNKEQKEITGDKDGNPILVDPPKPSDEEAKKTRINELEMYLDSTDWYIVRNLDDGKKVPDEIKKNRESARNEISKLREELSEDLEK